jgi:AAA15 family ATPase/GTPase
VGANVNNIDVIFLKHMVRYQKLSNEELDSRWMCLGYDKNFMLKGHYIKVTSKLKSKFVPL